MLTVSLSTLLIACLAPALIYGLYVLHFFRQELIVAVEMVVETKYGIVFKSAISKTIAKN